MIRKQRPVSSGWKAGRASQGELRLTTATSYFLTQTTILAALASLERAGKAQAIITDNRLLWQRP